MIHRLGVTLAALVLAVPTAASVAREKEVTKVLPLVGPGEVFVKSYKGTIRVRAWDRSEVGVKARVVAQDACGSAAEQVEKTEIVIEPVGGGVEIRAEYGRIGSGFPWFGCTTRPQVHFEVSLPRKADLRVKDYKSRVDVEGLEGDVRLHSYKGTLRLTGLEGGLDLETYKGDVTVATALRKPTRIETQKADVTLTIPKGAAFSFEARLGRRASFDSDLPLKTGHRRRTTHYAEAVNGGGPLLSLRTHKGEFRLRER